PAIVAVFADPALWAQPPSWLAPILRQVLGEGPKLGIYSVFLDARPERLPQECRAVLDATGPTTVLRTRRPPASDGVEAFAPDGPPTALADAFARACAPLRLAGQGARAAALPRAVPLLDLFGGGPVETLGAIQQWE